MPILTLPIAVLAAFIPMYYLHVSSNIMSLGGLALAIGVLIDAAIVMVENGYRHLAERSGLAAGEHTEKLSSQNAELSWCERRSRSARRLFYSLIIIVVSFLPVFLLEAQEGRMFRPLAWTKTLALVFSSLLSITLVPALMPLFIRGRLRPESQNPAARITQAIYLPVLRWCLRHWKIVIALNLDLSGSHHSAVLPTRQPVHARACMRARRCTCPARCRASPFTQATSLMQEQDRIIRSFPEVETVFGTVGRSDSATDNAPLDMYDTTIMLKPREQWRPGMTYEKLIQEMDAKLQFPGLTNTWTMPVRNRLDMELTGHQDAGRHQDPGARSCAHPGYRRAACSRCSTACQQTSSVFAERVSQGFYLNVEVNRPEAARYGLTVADVQRVITSAIGGAEHRAKRGRPRALSHHRPL